VGGENWLWTSGAASAYRLGTGSMVGQCRLAGDRATGGVRLCRRCEIMTAVQVAVLWTGSPMGAFWSNHTNTQIFKVSKGTHFDVN
jgi:hypothetical protein